MSTFSSLNPFSQSLAPLHTIALVSCPLWPVAVSQSLGYVMASNVIPIPLIPKVVNSLLDTKYATVASITLLLWDMALTFELELRRVWFAPKTLGTTLFIVNRYIPPFLFALDVYAQFTSHSSEKLMRMHSSCKRYQIASTILQLVCIAIVESVLVMRTNALYQNKGLFICLLGLCFISMVNMLSLFLFLLQFETISSAKALGIEGCISGCVHTICRPLLIGFWVPFLFFETLVFFLTIWKSYTSFESYRRSRGAGRDTLLDVIIRDGLIYFVVIMAVSLCNFLIWITDPYASYLAVGLLKSLQATICSRMLLNLRGMLETRRPSTTATGVQFTQTATIDLDDLRPMTASMNLGGSHVASNITQ